MMAACTIFYFLVLVLYDPDPQAVPLRLAFQLEVLGSTGASTQALLTVSFTDPCSQPCNGCHV